MKANVFEDKISYKNKFYYGIDLGTTNSSIAVARSDSIANMIPVLFASAIMPSCISWTGEGREFLVGHEAYALRDQPYSAYSVKRIIGEDRDIVLRKGRKVLRMKPYEVSAEVLRGLIKQVAEYSNYRDIKDVVITVPSYFSPTQIENTIKAARLADLNILKLAKEPTAAAICVSQTISQSSEDKYHTFVYDLGGGTFDISLIETRKEQGRTVIDVIAVDGCSNLGGDDIDRNILNILKQKLKKEENINLADITEAEDERLLLQINNWKRTEDAVTKYKINIRNKQYTVDCSPRNVGDATRAVVEKTIPYIYNLIKQNEHINAKHIIPVGGVTKSRYVRQFLTRVFSRIDLIVNPDEAVTLGAALEAYSLRNKNSKLIVKDVVPTPISVAKASGELEVLVPQYAKLPFMASRTYTVVDPDTEGVQLKIFSGTGLSATGTQIGLLEIEKPEDVKSIERIQVTYIVDSNGQLTVEGEIGGKKARTVLTNVFTIEQLASSEQRTKKEKQVAKWRMIAAQKNLKTQKEIIEKIEIYEEGRITEGEIREYMKKVIKG